MTRRIVLARSRRPGFRLAALRRDDAGAAVVEFALVAPVLLVLVFAIIDFGRALYTQNVLTSAVREGARYGASRTLQTQIADSAKYRTAAYIGRILLGAATDSAAVVAYPVTNVDAQYSTTTGLLTVQLGSGYSYTPLIPFARRWFGTSLILRPKAIFRWEQSS